MQAVITLRKTHPTHITEKETHRPKGLCTSSTTEGGHQTPARLLRGCLDFCGVRWRALSPSFPSTKQAGIHTIY
eukprot:1159973-Pelagomonas_calceolata.AAC.14